MSLSHTENKKSDLDSIQRTPPQLPRGAFMAVLGACPHFLLATGTFSKATCLTQIFTARIEKSSQSNDDIRSDQ